MTHKITAALLAAIVLATTATGAFAVKSSTVTCNDGTEVEVGDADPQGQAQELCLTHGGVEQTASTSFGFTTKQSRKIVLKR